MVRHVCIWLLWQQGMAAPSAGVGCGLAVRKRDCDKYDGKAQGACVSAAEALSSSDVSRAIALHQDWRLSAGDGVMTPGAGRRHDVGANRTELERSKCRHHAWVRVCLDPTY